MAGVEQMDRLPTRRGPGRVSTAEPDPDDGEQVRPEAVVERQARSGRPRRSEPDAFTSIVPTGSGSSPSDADVVDQQRAEDGAHAAGERDQQGQPESGGGGSRRHHLRPSAVAATTPAPARRSPWRRGSRRSCAISPSLANNVASTASVEYVVHPPRKPMIEERTPQGSTGRDVFGERDQQPDGEGAGQVDQQCHPGEMAGRDRVVSLELVAGHGAECAADEDGQHGA